MFPAVIRLSTAFAVLMEHSAGTFCRNILPQLPQLIEVFLRSVKVLLPLRHVCERSICREWSSALFSSSGSESAYDSLLIFLGSLIDSITKLETSSSFRIAP